MARIEGFGAPGKALIPKPVALDLYARHKADQQATLQKHQAFAEQLQVKQAATQQRGADLDVAGRLFKILDSRLPKQSRAFLNKELAKHVGVDPKAESFKDIDKMLTGLDPDTLTRLKSGFSQSLEGAQPGQITEMVRGIMTGQVSMNDFIDQVGGVGSVGAPAEQGQVVDQYGTTQTAGEGEPPKEQDRLKEDQPTATGEAQLPKPFQGGTGAIQSFEGQRTVPSAAQQASPTIVGALGLDSRQRYRNNDLITNGYRIPFDPKEQDKLAEGLNTRTSGLSATISESVGLVNAFEGRPETLGPVGSATRTIQSTLQQVQGILNLAGIEDKADPLDPAIQRATRVVANKLAKSHAIDSTAETSAQIQARVLGLAYRMAIAQDIPGNRLTNAIIDQNLRQIGNSSSPTQFKAVIKSTLESTTREFDEQIRRQVGVGGLDIMARQLTDDDINNMTKRADILPKDMATSLLSEAQRRKTGVAGQAITPASPTLGEEEATIGTLETEKKSRDINRQDQTMRLENEREVRAREAAERAEGREERVTRTQAESAALQRETFEASKAERARDNAFQREQFEASKAERSTDNAFQREQFDYRKAQDVKERDERQAAVMAKAFAQFGQAIAQSGGGQVGGGSYSPGPGQDVSAFRLAPPPQRTPPRPGGR